MVNFENMILQMLKKETKTFRQFLAEQHIGDEAAIVPLRRADVEPGPVFGLGTCEDSGVCRGAGTPQGPRVRFCPSEPLGLFVCGCKGGRFAPSPSMDG